MYTQDGFGRSSVKPLKPIIPINETKSIIARAFFLFSKRFPVKSMLVTQTKCVGDNFEMLTTDLIISVTNIKFVIFQLPLILTAVGDMADFLIFATKKVLEQPKFFDMKIAFSIL